MSADMVQKAHPATKGPMSFRVTENIVSEVEMVELIYAAKDDLKSVKLSLMYFYLLKYFRQFFLRAQFPCPSVVFPKSS